MEIITVDLQKKIKIIPRQVKALVLATLKHLKVKNAELSIVFVNARQIKSLNKKFLGRTYATDVLAFDQTDEINSLSKRDILRGDVIVSVDAARIQSKEYLTSFSEELSLYIIHGILHLLGYDDHKPIDIMKMRTKESEVVEALKSKKVLLSIPKNV